MISERIARRIEKLFEQAEEAEDADDHRLAVRLYDTILGIDPSNEDAIKLRELANDEVGDLIVVAADGSGGYTDISEALEVAEDGDAIKLGPGSYRVAKPIEIVTSLSIFGEDRADTKIVGDTDGPLLAAHDAHLVVSNVAFERVGKHAGDVLVCYDGSLSLLDCYVAGGHADNEEGGSGAGVTVVGSVSCEIARCVFERNTIAVYHGGTDNSSLKLLDCTCTGGELGVIVREKGHAELEGNRIDGASDGTIAFLDHATGIARNNACTSKGVGISVLGDASAQLEGNTVEGKFSGIRFSDRATGLVHENTVRNSGIGISVGGDASPTLKENVCEKNQDAGIRFDENASGECSRNTCATSGGFGIFVAGAATPVLEDNVTTTKCGDKLDASDFTGCVPSSGLMWGGGIIAVAGLSYTAWHYVANAGGIGNMIGVAAWVLVALGLLFAVTFTSKNTMAFLVRCVAIPALGFAAIHFQGASIWSAWYILYIGALLVFFVGAAKGRFGGGSGHEHSSGESS